MNHESHLYTRFPETPEPLSGDKGLSEIGLAGLVERQLTRYINADRQVLPASGLHARIMNEVERPLLRLVLNLVNGNKIQAAQILGMNRNTLLKKLRMHGLEKAPVADTHTRRSASRKRSDEGV